MRNFISSSGAQVHSAAMDSGEYPEKELTGKIIGCAIAVHKTLGPGYVENVYENALEQFTVECTHTMRTS
jgi:hypothetical protein